MSGAVAVLPFLPELGPPGWIALGVIGLAAGGMWIAHSMSASSTAQANMQAQTQLSDAAPAETCKTCKPSPCAALAAGVPGSKYRGGAHAAMILPTGDGLESHHMPADAASPLPRAVGPAIQMDPADHARTQSNGRMPGFRAYIAAQRSMVESGNFMGATAMDVADVKAKFGDKYDGALAQMAAYAACLKANNIVE